MDKFLDLNDRIPALPAERLEQMTELAMTYRQQVPGNENRPALFSFLSLRWASAFSATACVLVAVAVLALQPSSSVVPDTHSVSVAALEDDDVMEADYEDLTDLALLQTLESF